INLHKIFDTPDYNHAIAAIGTSVAGAAVEPRQTKDEGAPQYPSLKIKTRFRTMGDPFTRKNIREVTLDYTLINTPGSNNKKLRVRAQRKDDNLGLLLDVGKFSATGTTDPKYNQFSKQARTSCNIVD